MKNMRTGWGDGVNPHPRNQRKIKIKIKIIEKGPKNYTKKYLSPPKFLANRPPHAVTC